ncbi:hypothetical protein ACHAW5_007367 [Stephanodiscus triporus]|uniref:Uncharacterized protein n=1 Tax=Stephanodiscus triporus TaxID=2934178 RepID=A0ABD3P4J6_9STRA
MILSYRNLKCTDSRNPGINCRVVFRFRHIKLIHTARKCIHTMQQKVDFHRKRQEGFAYVAWLPFPFDEKLYPELFEMHSARTNL